MGPTGPQGTLGNLGILHIVQDFLGMFLDFLSNIKVYGKNNVFLSFSSKNHAESSRNLVKNPILNSKHAKFDQKS